ncbi:MAG: cytochrome P450 [Gemmatimonadetes bacterium]|nr:cytochrome P450 [Gemmatimonadota bacterium]
MATALRSDVAAPPRRTALPPGPRARYPGQFLLEIRRRGILPFLRDVVAPMGDVVHWRMLGEHMTLVNHPDLIRDVLVTHQKLFHKGRGLERTRILLGNGLLTSEGDFHLRQRRLASPAFHRQRIATCAGTMTGYAERHARQWRAGETRDVAADMMRLTLAIAGKALFDADVEGEAAEIGRALTAAFESFNLSMLPGGQFLSRLPIPAARRFRRARERLDATIYRMIADRRASGADRGDLLSMLMAATDTEGDGSGMTDEQLRDECLTIFLAGHETTANALTWTWYLLGEHPEAESKMHAEIDALGGRVPTLDDLPRLSYTRMVMAEAMRLYPPAYVLGRRAQVPYEVGGFTLPARTVVFASQFLAHRDPRWWPAPERFRPERFAPEESESRPKFAYFPFGAGTRVCIGEQFAWMEGVLTLATIGREWRLRLDPSQVVALQPIVTLRPKFGMRMRCEPRR